MSRWIRVSTSIFDHELFTQEPLTEREAWLWLISKAAWKDTRHRVGGTVLDVPAGSLFATLRDLQRTWKWKSDTKVRSFLGLLCKQDMIAINTNAGKTQITICNYSKYQNSERSDNVPETQQERSDNALKTPIYQDTSNTSSLRSDVRPEPRATPASPTVIELTATQGQLVAITEAEVTEWIEAFPAVDVRQQLRTIRQWLINNPPKRKTVRGMRRFVVSWLSRAQDKGGLRPTGPPAQTPHQQRHQAAVDVFERYGSQRGDRQDDDFAGNTIELADRDFRAH